MDLQKSFIEPAESCPHRLKITLWKKVGRLVQQYRIFPNMLSNTSLISDMEVTDPKYYDR